MILWHFPICHITNFDLQCPGLTDASYISFDEIYRMLIVCSRSRRMTSPNRLPCQSCCHLAQRSGDLLLGWCFLASCVVRRNATIDDARGKFLQINNDCNFLFNVKTDSHLRHLFYCCARKCVALCGYSSSNNITKSMNQPPHQFSDFHGLA